MQVAAGFRLFSIVAAGVLLASCSKMSNYQKKAIEFRQECFGDHTVKCRAMMVDVGVAQLEAGMELVGKSEDAYVACRGRAAYDDGIALFKEKIEHYKDLKPNIFKRILLSGMEVEFEQTPFKNERRMEEFIHDLDRCRRGEAASVAKVDQAPVQNQAPVQGHLDSNAPEVKEALNTVAGQLVRDDTSAGNSFMKLNGQRLFSGDDANWQYPVRVFKLSQRREAILMTSTGGRGNSCESLFFFLVAGPEGVKPTPEFGTCSPTGSFSQDGDRITITLPKMGGNSQYALDGMTVTEDGNPVQLTESNDPSK